MISPTRVWGSVFLLLLAVFVVIVFSVSSWHPGFHGLAEMPKQTILALRTTLAGLSIFLFFPIIWCLNQRETAAAKPRELGITLAAFALAEMPAVFGLAFFLIRGAFRTFFAFLILSIFYLFIVLLRSRS